MKDFNRTLSNAAVDGDVHLVKDCLKKGADINYRDDDGITPLHLSAKEGHTDVTKALMEAGASLSAVNNGGMTPLHRAAIKGHTDVTKAIMEAGASLSAVDNKGMTPLHWAAMKGHTDVTKAIMEAGASLSAVDNKARTPLHLSAMKGRIDVTKALVEAKASLSAVDNDARTPLHLSAMEGHTDVTKALMEAKASLSAVDNDGMTPLHLSAMEGHTDVTKALMEAGASLSAVDNDMAVKSTYAVVELIKEESVAVALRSWIDRDEEGLFCYWPNTSYSLRVKRGEQLVKDKSKTYHIRIFGYAETYQLAISKANKAVETSHLKLMEEIECTVNKKTRKRTSKNTESEDKDCGTPHKRPRLNKSNGKGRDISLPKPPNFSEPRENSLSGIESPNLQPERLTNTFRLTDIIPSSSDHDEPEIRQHQQSPCRYKTNENFQTKVLMKLEEIIEHQKTSIDILRQNKNQDVVDGNNGIPFEDLESPMDGEKELEDFNDKLRTEPNFRDQMIKYMQGIGGRNCGEGVRRIMSKLGTIQLWSMFSLKGKRKKKCFHDLPLCKILIRTCRNVYNVEEQEVETALSEMLKHCPNKPGGSRYKESSTNKGDMLDA